MSFRRRSTTKIPILTAISTTPPTPPANPAATSPSPTVLASAGRISRSSLAVSETSGLMALHNAALLLFNAIQILPTAQKQLLADNRGRCIRRIVELVCRQDLKLICVLDDHGRPVAADEIDSARCSHRRGIHR